jgi:fucose permease
MTGPGGPGGTPDAPGGLRPRLVRDRLTLTLYGGFVMWGWFLYGFSPAVPIIAAEQGISRAQAGLHGTAMALGTVLAGTVSATVAVRLGRRLQAVLGCGIVVVGIGMLLVGQTLPATLTAVVVAAIGGNFLLSAAQPALAVHHGSAGPAAVTEANAMGSSFGLLAPLVVGGTVALGWGWRPAVGLVVVLATALALVLLRMPTTGALGKGTPTRRTAAVQTAGPGAETVAADRRRARSDGFSRVFWFFWAAMLAGVAIEFATTFWAADLMSDRTGAGPSLSTASVSALVAGMSVARFIVGPLSMRKAPEKLLLVAYALAGVGFAVFWTTTDPVVAVVGLVVMGLGYGAHYPLAVALVLRASDGRPDQAQARSTIGVGCAVAVAPFLLGALADQFGAHLAFLLVPVLILLGFTAVALGLRAVQQRDRQAA